MWASEQKLLGDGCTMVVVSIYTQMLIFSSRPTIQLIHFISVVGAVYLSCSTNSLRAVEIFIIYYIRVFAVLFHNHIPLPYAVIDVQLHWRQHMMQQSI